jgi:hypothetical protein
LVDVGDTLIESVVAPVLQRYLPPPVAISVTVLPGHIFLGEVIVTIGTESTVTVTAVSLLQPLSVITAVNVVVDKGVTEILLDVDALLHK